MVKENLVRLFEQSIKDNWELPALTNYIEKTTYTYGEVAEEIEKLHIFFEKVGIQQGDKIALCGKNGAHWCIVYIATITYGAALVSILPDFNPADVEHIIDHSDSRLVFTSHGIWDKLNVNNLPKVLGAFNLSGLGIQYASETSNIQEIHKNIPQDFANKFPDGIGPADILYPTIPNTELASMSYTSGTSGFSKGVMLSGNAFAANIAFGIESKLIEQGDRSLAVLPLAHAYGCAYDFLTTFCVGGHITLLGKIPSPNILIKAMQEVKPTCIFMVPLILEKIYRKQIQPLLNSRSMRLAMSIPLVEAQIRNSIRNKISDSFGGAFKEVIIGGAAMNPEVADFFKRIGFKFSIGYGMTECAPLISYTPWDEYKSGSVGKILPNMEVKILSENPQTITGEICVRGEHVMMGYYKNEEATTDAIDSEGWLHTGDMGTVDLDGTIYIKGRNKSMLLGPSGQNIYPEEIEAKLNNLPFIMESLVIQNKDGKLIALACPDPDEVKDSNISQSDLELMMQENKKMLNTMVGNFERIAEIRLHNEEFAKTPKRSIKRYLYQDKVD